MFFRTQTAIAIFLFLFSVTACKSADQEQSLQAEQPAADQTQQMPEREYGEGLDIKGQVLETIDVGGYTYMQVDDDQGPTWVAVPQTQLEQGQEVSITEGMEMRNFESKTLNRTFDKIYFSAAFEGETTGSAVERNPEGRQADPHAGIPGAPVIGASEGTGSFEEALQAEGMGSRAPMVDPADLTGGSMAARVTAADDIQVEKAEGENAYSVGELFDKRKELDNQTVRVQGKVVKMSPMIMGKNWLHIQDGTASSAGNNDLVVTTMAEAEKDSIVVVEGTLHADRDFGSGYQYEVIVEDAELK
ncbi:MAG: DNA-binding protein [Desulfobulbaceae bacterium]|nr:DNA-binding protein [Desulfobulbaceae bacterium]